MSKDDAPFTPPPVRRLSEVERERTLGKLRRLETAALFTPEWERVADLLWGWRWTIGRDELTCEDVPRIAAELKRWGVR